MSGLFTFHETVNKVVMLPIDLIDPNPMQPRKHFSQQAITELAASIQSNGLLQPIIVRRGTQGRYELVAGHRRMLAFQMLGKRGIPAIIDQMDDKVSAVMAVVENLQRQDLDYFEEAEGIAALIELCGLSQQEAAAKLGKAQSTIANKLRLLKLPYDARTQLRQAGLTERHSRALLPLANSPKLMEAIDAIVRNQWNVEATERYVARLVREKEGKPTRLVIIRDLRIFFNTINKAIETMMQAGVPVDSERTEDEDAIRYTITIPKEAAYQKKSTA